MNAFATFMLFAWVPISIVIAKKYRPSIAAAVLLLGAVMFLPQQVDVKVPGIIGFDKSAVASLWCAIAIATARPALRKRFRVRGFLAFLVALTIVSIVGTGLSNTDSYAIGGRPFDGLDALDIVQLLEAVFLRHLLPLFIGFVVFRTRDEVRDFFVVLAGAGLVYSLPMIVEKIVSPQLHRWVYGDHQHEFLQTIRGGGFRPMVFMTHGLAVALFTVAALIAGITLHRLGIRWRRIPGRRVAMFLGAMVVACNSAGALIYGAVATPALLATKRRVALPLAFAFTVGALFYPLLVHSEIVPREQLVELARTYGNDDRAASLEYRFLNEQLCFERGLERPIFGWGGFDRGSIHDPADGRTVSVRDGHWVIMFGEFGIVGYAAHFGWLAYPVLLAFRRRKSFVDRFDVATIPALALMVGIHVLDLVPNGMFSILPAFFSGVLLGAVTGAEQERALARARRHAG